MAFAGFQARAPRRHKGYLLRRLLGAIRGQHHVNVTGSDRVRQTDSVSLGTQTVASQGLPYT